MLRLSQGQLTLLEYCPRRFQHTILESLSVPASPALMEGQKWGDRFHLLMQQREMGLPIDPVLSHDEELQTCLQKLIAKAPELFDTRGETFRQSEHERSLTFNNYWFTVVYDLLRQWDDHAEIIDWKTYLRPRSLPFLQQDWQTRLYLYVLVESTNYVPSQVSMTYWFVRAETPNAQTQDPQKVYIPYSNAIHQQTSQDIERLTHQLTQLLESNKPFPQVPLDSPRCDACPFAIRCQRGEARSSDSIKLPSLDEIEEIAI
ncbi:PD-(D/E)XK nuclease family protein [Oscillatoria sp. CS-180]|uniref:PD-(D/E)XK nuclease family protein n=1 Tax=Oscillatoria sp. CS-180 TaxID=3021720 RepID=UPI00232E5910|nr:PD-(D/E)XK nuclease family protein [Oscillatoria sp. CS-180]MDB9525386.1 PD-(D/E)XK nuclease family protein [Oscillatoria sp. CS-180]